MSIRNFLNIYLIIIIIHKISALSYNQPKFCPYASWNPNAIIFDEKNTIQMTPSAVFVNSNNTIYVVNFDFDEIDIWINGSINSIKTPSNNSMYHLSIFVTTNGDIYISSADWFANENDFHGRVDKWTSNTNTWDPIIYDNGLCLGLFVDINNTLYCSMLDRHQVVKKWLNDNTNTWITIAGTGLNGSEPNMLDEPFGIFVDTNFDLYVADCRNDRIQLFRPGQMNATTVAGAGSARTTITLNRPTGVILDADGYLFIIEWESYRIISSGPNGFRCIIACSDSNIPDYEELYFPPTLSFDSHGNIFVPILHAFQIVKFVISTNSCTLSYNQPKICPSATWNLNAITFANNSTVGSAPYGIFIDSNNTVYVPNREKGQIYIWANNNTNATRIISGNLSYPWSIFVTMNGDIYIDNGELNDRVDKWTSSTNTWTPIMYVNAFCTGLFVDINNTIYCSMINRHQVVKKWVTDNASTSSIAAGTGMSSFTSNALSYPHGIFVDTNYDLYVADTYNHRIQLFRSCQLNATTVAGAESPTTTITLVQPTGIALDADRCLFIIEWGSHRIVRSGPHGFLCIVGCSTSSGSSPNQLSHPYTLSFDGYGNIFVADGDNNRIQKFLLEDNSCDVTTNIPTTMETTMTTTTTSEPIITDPTCSSPEIKLIPESLSPLSPLQFRRSQDFYILSTVKLNCNKSLSKTTKWIIKNYTTTQFYEILMNKKIISTNSELFIPANILPYGIYQLTLTVSMIADPTLTNSSSVYVHISPSGITANLVPLGTSVLTSGHQQNLILDPGNFSMDPDGYPFNASDWIYTYSCRVYDIAGQLLPLNSCLTATKAKWEYTGVKLSPESSITILGGSLQLNRKYQFLVQMANRRNASLQATGYVLVQIEDSNRPMIAIGCVIWTICAQNLEFQRVNPTTQVALYSRCVENCTDIQNITWNIYYGQMNSDWNFTKWTLFDQINQYENSWFFGKNTSNFTATNNLFINYPNETLWKFEVVYTFQSVNSLSALNFIINPPPSNGSCEINPSHGNTSTIFNVTCSDWYNKENIKDYTLYTWKTDRSKLIIIAFSPIPIFDVQLPAGIDLHLVIHIRDLLDCVTEYNNISSITVLQDLTSNMELINTFRESKNKTQNNELIQVLSSGNQNQIGQVITSISQVFDQINNETIEKAISNGIALTSISISSLGSPNLQQNSTPFNESALLEYNKERNFQANLREYLIKFTNNLSITSSNSIKLQSLSLVQLTNATNQLTRTTLMIASDNCYRLSRSLHSLLTKIPYEDVQIAATQLLQCASNILTAVNAPLQERTSVLESDSSKATNFPEDYDTNLELEWANPNLFADGNDFSWETLQHGRIVYYQRKLADQITTKMTEMISLLTATLNIHLNIGQNLTMNTSEVFMSLETITVQSLINKTIKQVGDARIYIPLNFSSNLNPNQTISLRSIMEPLASYGKSHSQSHTNLSRSISFSILYQDGKEIPVRTSILHPIEIIIPRDPNLFIPPMILQNITSTPHNQTFNFHHLNITSILPISVHFEIDPLNSNLSYLFIYKFDQYPLFNSSIQRIDGWTLLCPLNLTDENIYRYFINNQDTLRHQNITFGLRELNSTEMNDFCFNTSMITPLLIENRFDFTSNYKLRVYTSGCYYLDENNQWKSNGVLVGPLTNLHQTQCFSTHLTTFSGSLHLLPESINFDYVLSNIDPMKNKTIYLTVICMLIIYIILIMYARSQDRKDVQKLGVTPLPDNHRSDCYYYQIIVFTGQRKDAGTKSKVHFIVSGNDQDTTIRTFADPRREIFQRGGVNAFIMAVPKSLGLLNYIHIWHDNSGEDSSASWFLKYIIIRDLQTMDKFHFIAQRWFAVEKDDGKIERILPVADEFEKHEFSYVLSKRAYHSMSDGHLWFSIFSRPPSNKFTRVQRCTCCFVLLFISMLLNIMYYGSSAEVDLNTSTNAVSLAFGPFLITLQQVLIGIIIEFLSLLSSLLLVQFFRRIRSRQNRISPLNQALIQMKPHQKIFVPNEKGRLTFPWWCLFIAYGLSFLLIITSILLIIARGIEFGDEKSQKWLTSIMSGLFSSIFVTQPMKVLCLAIFFAFFFRTANDDKEAKEYINENPVELNNDEEYLHSKNPFSVHRSGVHANRLTKYEIADARYRRLKDVQMWSIIREALTYFCFLIFLCVIVYSNRNSNSFLQVQHLRNYFSNSEYLQISRINEYWTWLERSFISNLRAQNWYNKEEPRNLSGFINDKTNRLIGWATMRQLRIKSDLCLSQRIRSICQGDYNLLNEEKRSFQPKWMSQTSSEEEEYSSSIVKAFRYQSAEELDSYVYIGEHETYNGGGYVYEFRGSLSDLRSNVSQLHQLGWIDEKTRAIFLQISLYNPNVELFTSITFLIEFLSTGGIYPQFRFEPMNFFAFTSFYQLICMILYMLIIIYFMWIEFESFSNLKWKYFRRFWSYVELGIIICSWTAVGVYIWRYKESRRISQLFKQSNGFIYINLQLSSYVNDLLTYLFGFCCFFGTIKILRLCRLNRRLSLFGQTLENAGKELGSFSLMFSLIFIAFICLFYFLFVSQISACSSLLKTSQMLFEMTLLKLNTRELIRAEPFLGPFSFSLFILLVAFICMNIFLSIINESFHRAKEKKDTDQEMLSYIFKKFLRWTGLKKPNQLELAEERDARMRSKYIDPIEHFPDKIDQLFEALDRLQMNITIEGRRRKHRRSLDQ